METYSDESWDLLLQASRKPKLGYLFRDGPDPQVQLSTVMVATSFSRWQARQFSIALHLLQGEAHRSLENTDPDRAVELALAVLRLARLASDADNHPSVIQLGDNGSFEVLALMGTLCQTRQLSAAALVRLRDALLESPPAALPPLSGRKATLAPGGHRRPQRYRRPWLMLRQRRPWRRHRRLKPWPRRHRTCSTSGPPSTPP
jgi:hypothetical protein